MLRLWIKDNTNGHVHEYGTNPHDSLYMTDDGALHYYNMQNGTGTMFPEEGYSFCLEDGSDPRATEDYRDEPYVDIGGERTPGTWREENTRLCSSIFICSVCHKKAYSIQANRKGGLWHTKRCRYAFCPNCGAPMEAYEK